jgi:hypothetical protein
MAVGESPSRIARDIISYRPLNVPRLEHKRGLRDFMGSRYTHVYVAPSNSKFWYRHKERRSHPGRPMRCTRFGNADRSAEGRRPAAGCNAASIKLKILGSTEYDDLRGEPTVLLGIRPERKSA